MSRRALVTGASGFIGASLVPALVGAGWEVRTVGRRQPPSPPPGVEHRCLDLLDADAIDPALEGVTDIVHLAGASSSFADEEQMRRINVTVTENLVNAVVHSRLDLRTLLYTSTSAVYGEAVQLLTPISEDTPPQPSRPYGQTKWEAEQVIWRAARDVPAVVLRPVSVYGPGAVKLVASSILDAAIERHAGRATLEIPPDLVEQRVVHIDDVVAACLHLLDADAAGRAFNLASGTYPTSHELGRAIATALDMNVQLAADGGLSYEERAAHRDRLAADGMDGSIMLTKRRLSFLSRGNRNNRLSLSALASTGFVPRVTDLDGSIASLVGWYREHHWIM